MRWTLVLQRNLRHRAVGLLTHRAKNAVACPKPRPARRVGRPAALNLISCAVVLIALAAAGCGPTKLRTIDTEYDFNKQVLKAERPAVVYFTKEGCAACMFLNPCVDQLYDEYQGRVEFVEFDLMTFWGSIKCDGIWRRHRVAYFPTVILFVGGKEKHRWVGEYSREAYRKVLSEVAPLPDLEKPPVASSPSTGKLQ